jgi:putative ABC transport system substrate-binding protein
VGGRPNERFPELIRELVLLKPAAILAVSTPAAKAAAKETTAVPVIFIAADTVGSGLLSALGRPQGNLTGLSITLGENFAGKWLELLKETVPRMSKVSVLWNSTNPSNVGWMTSLRAAARTLGISLQPKEVRDPDQLQNTFRMIVADRAQALVVLPDPLTVRHRGRIVELAANNRLPAMYGFREFADAGGLMAYGVNVAYLCRRAAVYVDRILKGAKVSDLPVEQSTKFELVVNVKAARALGLTVPSSVLLRADQVLD